MTKSIKQPAASELSASAGSRLAWVASRLTVWRVDIGNRAEMQWIDKTGSTRKIEVEIKGADSFSEETDLQLLEMAISLAIHSENVEDGRGISRCPDPTGSIHYGKGGEK